MSHCYVSTEYLVIDEGASHPLKNSSWLLEPCNDGHLKQYRRALCGWKFRMKNILEGKKTSMVLPNSLTVLSKTERIKAAVGHITQPDCIPWKTEKSPPRNRNNWDDPCRETIKTNREFSIVLAQGFLTFRNRIAALLGLGPVLIWSSNWIQWFLLVKRFRPFKTITRLPPQMHSQAIQVLLQTQSRPAYSRAVRNSLLRAAGRGLSWCHTVWLHIQDCLTANNFSSWFVMIKNARHPERPWSGTQLEIGSLIFLLMPIATNFLPPQKQLLMMQQFRVLD